MLDAIDPGILLAALVLIGGAITGLTLWAIYAAKAKFDRDLEWMGEEAEADQRFNKPESQKGEDDGS